MCLNTKYFLEINKVELWQKLSGEAKLKK